MKKICVLIVLFGLVFQPGFSSLQPNIVQGSQLDEIPNLVAQAETGSDPPGWPVPDKPIPYHEPGHLSRAGGYITQMLRENEVGMQKRVEINGIDAMAADGLSLLSQVFTPSGYSQAMLASALSLSDSQKAEILETYAPRVWLASEELFFPSPVEFSFQYNRRMWEPEDHKNWWLYTYEDMDNAESVLDYFHGCDGDPCKLSDVPVYAFWDEVLDVDIGGQSTDVVDLIYFFWFPYNRGKYMFLVLPPISVYVGNHVGDWEHISIRLVPEWDEGAGQWIYAPYQIYLSRNKAGNSELLYWGDDEIK